MAEVPGPCWGQQVLACTFTPTLGNAVHTRSWTVRLLCALPSLLLLLSRFSRVRLCDPIDGSPPGSPVPGILPARTLEWVSIAFSNA